MKRTAKYWEMVGRLSAVSPEDYETRQDWMQAYMQIRRLAMKHHRLAEMECNGEGYVNGKFYRLDGSTPGAYISDEVSVFSAASDRLETRIKAIGEPVGISVEFQGDPRGNTVQLTFDSKNVPLFI